MSMDIDRYLERISCPRPVRPDLEGLRAVHSAHLLAIPYENIDVQLQRPVGIARPAIYEKIVERRRGGWCYEMNGLLGWALGELGFRVTRATGAVRRDAFGDALSVANHLVLRVDLEDGPYLADVGFGDGPLYPFKVEEGRFSDGRFDFHLTRADKPWWRFHNAAGGGAPTFDFALSPADEKLFAEKCEFLQTAQMSPFVQNLVCQRHTQDGVTVLRGRVLRTITPSGVSERLVETADELVAVLKKTFALDVPEIAALWPKIMARHEAVFTN